MDNPWLGSYLIRARRATTTLSKASFYQLSANNPKESKTVESCLLQAYSSIIDDRIANGTYRRALNQWKIMMIGRKLHMCPPGSETPLDRFCLSSEIGRRLQITLFWCQKRSTNPANVWVHLSRSQAPRKFVDIVVELWLQ